MAALSTSLPTDTSLPNAMTQDWFTTARRVISPHCDTRPDGKDISLLVIHNISLPPGQYDNNYIEDFFSGALNPDAHPYFQTIHSMRVSAHCLIKRCGEIIQFVPFEQRAWHAGVSSFQGRQRCNDYSIGVELEGTDAQPFSQKQYESLIELTRAIMVQYPRITLGRIVGHNDIAPGRKTDPGVHFDWARLRVAIQAFKPLSKQQ